MRKELQAIVITIIVLCILVAIFAVLYEPSESQRIFKTRNTSVVNYTKIEIQTTKLKYEIEEPIQVRAIVTNIGDEPIVWYSGPPEYFTDITIYIDSDYSVYGSQRINPEMGPAILVERTLLPDENLQADGVWNQKIFFYNIIKNSEYFVQAPSDEYMIRAIFTPTNAYVSTTVRIGGNIPKFITENKATQIAMAQSETLNWYNARLGPNLVKYENDHYYAKIDGKFVEVDYNLEKMSSHKPSIEKILENGYWTIRFIHALGFAPHETFEIMIEAYTGEVIAFEETGED